MFSNIIFNALIINYEIVCPVFNQHQCKKLCF